MSEDHQTDSGDESRQEMMLPPAEDTSGGRRRPGPVFLCTRCARPIPEGAYYCPHCGQGASQLTPYIPYVNIRFNYGPFGELWKTAKGETGAGPLRQFLTGLFYFLMAPLLLLALPFVIVEWIHNRKAKDGDERRQDR